MLKEDREDKEDIEDIEDIEETELVVVKVRVRLKTEESNPKQSPISSNASCNVSSAFRSI